MLFLVQFDCPPRPTYGSKQNILLIKNFLSVARSVSVIIILNTDNNDVKNNIY